MAQPPPRRCSFLPSAPGKAFFLIGSNQSPGSEFGPVATHMGRRAGGRHSAGRGASIDATTCRSRGRHRRLHRRRRRPGVGSPATAVRIGRPPVHSSPRRLAGDERRTRAHHPGRVNENINFIHSTQYLRTHMHAYVLHDVILLLLLLILLLSL